ncbi:polyprenyl synthetase family protein [Teredinibacter purpureus]|jgi:Geranylgeranyl pyrophosphate synthase|uniref:polyprenyl synthetase family protein n=1 Tax=Teredinibacter purpureus TaxID=2731756 RepID=UPI0005F80F8D|nr:polyprenyl synthetase family protein [Teredinibacter purpureus]
MQSFHEVVQNDFESVNRLIIDQLHSDVALVENIGHYIVDAGGKRLRPLLVLLMANALNYKGQQHIDLAAIIEFIHTATLLHDDVVDVSSLRRGRPTANAEWGNAPSVLVGDFLYSRSFQMMVAIGNMDIMAILSDTTNIISEGEVQQLVNARNPDVTEDNYLTVIHKKTAALFEAACEIGAVIAGANAQQRAQARQIGYHLGVAFQLIDDALDYEGNAEELGKNVGDDLAEGKPTLPLIHAIANGTSEEAELVKQSIRDGDINKLQQIITIVQQRGGLEYTKECARNHAEKAQALIANLSATPYQSALADLTRFSVERSN